MYFTYILKNLKDNSFYYGFTSNLEKRLDEHNKGKVKYTKGHLPWRLHYFEKYKTRSESIRRENFFKSISGYN
ncbi:MAG: GIY-YIG nuclease family protein [Melioribacteraceae bacterium]|nr:GIY-YIG nuclease family protein [Melioribacteraceae bacterium]